MATVDALISTAVNRADSFAAQAVDAINSIDARKGSIGYAQIDIPADELTAKYVSVPADTTPMPVYEPPSGAMPSSPTLVELPNIAVPGMPSAPSISTEGLFKQTMPSSTMPDWNEANPSLHVDDIYNALLAVGTPVLRDYDFPDITPLSIRQAPELQLPEYVYAPTPEQMDSPQDYAKYMRARYEELAPEMRAFVDDTVSAWISRYAPEFDEQRLRLNEKLIGGLEGGVLPDQFEDAMYSRARDKAESEYVASENALLDQGAKRGFILPPGAVAGGMHKARLATADSLANQATDIYIERRKTEVQHMQFVMGIMAQQVQGIRTIAVQYAQTGLQMIGESINLSKALTDMLGRVFEHERSKREFSLELMKALNEQFSARLEAALSGLKGYQLELEAAKTAKEVDALQVQSITARLQAQQIEVTRYSAIVDAITKRAEVDKLKLQDYSIRAQVFETNVRARVAAFDAYKAAIEGDKAKLQGELSKLEIYNSELKAVELNVGVQTEILKADTATNTARIGQYEALLDAYKTSAQIALQKFTSQAEIKKLGLEIYKTNVDANIEVYRGKLQADMSLIEARIKAFQGNVESLSNFYRLQQGYTELDLQKTTAIGRGLADMASAALQSLGTMVSQAA